MSALRSFDAHRTQLSPLFAMMLIVFVNILAHVRAGGKAEAEPSGKMPLHCMVIPWDDLKKVEHVGRGAQGAVYRGEWVSRGLEVAIKALDLDMHVSGACDIEARVREGMAQLQKTVDAAAKCERVCR